MIFYLDPLQQCSHKSCCSLAAEAPNQPLNNEHSCYSLNAIVPKDYCCCWYRHCGSSRSTAALILKIHCCFDIMDCSNSARKLNLIWLVWYNHRSAVLASKVSRSLE